MSGTCGPTSRMPFAFYDPDECCWRTSQATFLSDSDRFSGTWPRSGMACDGFAYELPMPALPTTAPESSSLLPTPAVNDMGAGKTVEAWDEWTAKMQAKHGNGNGHGPSLAIEAQRLLPTPVADHSRGLPQPGTDFQSLPNAVTSLLPTPGVAGGGKKIPEDAVWSGKAAYKPDGTKVQVHLDRIEMLLPTPTAMDAHGSRGYQPNGEPYTDTAGVTLTDAALSSSGAHTPPRLRGGSTSPDDPHQGQLSLDEPESA